MADSWERWSDYLANSGTTSTDSKAEKVIREGAKKRAFLLSEKAKTEKAKREEKGRELADAAVTTAGGRTVGEIGQDTLNFGVSTAGSALRNLESLAVDVPNLIAERVFGADGPIIDYGGSLGQRLNEWSKENIASDNLRAEEVLRDSRFEDRRLNLLEQQRQEGFSDAERVLKETWQGLGDLLGSPESIMQTAAAYGSELVGSGLGAGLVMKGAGKLIDAVPSRLSAKSIEALRKQGKISEAVAAEGLRNKIVETAGSIQALGVGDSASSINAVLREIDAQSWDEIISKLPDEFRIYIDEKVPDNATDEDKKRVLKDLAIDRGLQVAGASIALSKALGGDKMEKAIGDMLPKSLTRVVTPNKKQPPNAGKSGKTPGTTEALKSQENVTIPGKLTGVKKTLMDSAEVVAKAGVRTTAETASESVEEGGVEATEGVMRATVDSSVDPTEKIGKSAAIGGAVGTGGAVVSESRRNAKKALDHVRQDTTATGVASNRKRATEEELNKAFSQRAPELAKTYEKVTKQFDNATKAHEEALAAYKKEKTDANQDALEQAEQKLVEAKQDAVQVRRTREKILFVDRAVDGIGIVPRRAPIVTDKGGVQNKTLPSNEYYKKQSENGLDGFIGLTYYDDVVNLAVDQRPNFDASDKDKADYAESIKDAKAAARNNELALERELEKYSTDSAEYKEVSSALNKLRTERQKLDLLANDRLRQLKVSNEQIGKDLSVLNNPEATVQERADAAANLKMYSDPSFETTNQNVLSPTDTATGTDTTSTTDSPFATSSEPALKPADVDKAKQIAVKADLNPEAIKGKDPFSEMARQIATLANLTSQNVAASTASTLAVQTQLTALTNEVNTLKGLVGNINTDAVNGSPSQLGPISTGLSQLTAALSQATPPSTGPQQAGTATTTTPTPTTTEQKTTTGAKAQTGKGQAGVTGTSPDVAQASTDAQTASQTSAVTARLLSDRQVTEEELNGNLNPDDASTNSGTLLQSLRKILGFEKRQNAAKAEAGKEDEVSNDSQDRARAAEIALSTLEDIYEARQESLRNAKTQDEKNAIIEGNKKLADKIVAAKSEFSRVYNRAPVVSPVVKTEGPTKSSKTTQEAEAETDKVLTPWSRKGLQRKVDREYWDELTEDEQAKVKHLQKQADSPSTLTSTKKRAEKELDKFIRDVSKRVALGRIEGSKKDIAESRKIKPEHYTKAQEERLAAIEKELKYGKPDSKDALKKEREQIWEAGKKAANELRTYKKELELRTGRAAYSIHSTDPDSEFAADITPDDVVELSKQQDTLRRRVLKYLPTKLPKKVADELFEIIDALVFGATDADPQADPNTQLRPLTNEQLAGAILNVQAALQALAEGTHLAGMDLAFTSANTNKANGKYLLYKIAAVTGNLAGTWTTSDNNKGRSYIDYSKEFKNIFEGYDQLNKLGERLNNLLKENKDLFKSKRDEAAFRKHLVNNKGHNNFLKRFVRSRKKSINSMLQSFPDLLLQLAPLYAALQKHHDTVKRQLSEADRKNYVAMTGIKAEAVKGILEAGLERISHPDLIEMLQDEKFAHHLLNILPALYNMEKAVRTDVHIAPNPKERLRNLVNFLGDDILTSQEGLGLLNNPEYSEFKQPLAVRTATAMSALNWVARSGRGTLMPTNKDIRALMQKNNEHSPITARMRRVFTENGTFYSTAVTSMGTDIMEMLGIAIDPKAPGNMGGNAKESFGLLAMQAMESANIVQVRSKVRGKLGIFPKNKDDDNAAVRFVQLTKQVYKNKKGELIAATKERLDVNGEPVKVGGKILKEEYESKNNSALLESLTGIKVKKQDPLAPTDPIEQDPSNIASMDPQERPLAVLGGVTSNIDKTYPSFTKPESKYTELTAEEALDKEQSTQEEMHSGKISDRQEQILDKHRQVPHSLTTGMVRLFKSMAKQDWLRTSGFAVQADFKGKSVQSVEGMLAVNDQLEREYDMLANMIDRVEQEMERRKGEGELDLTIEDIEFYFDHDVWSVLRMGIASNGFNPQNSKMQRNVIQQSDWDHELDPANPDQLLTYKVAVLQGFGEKTENFTVDDVNTAFDELLAQDDIRRVLFLLQRQDSPEFESYTPAESEEIADIVSGNENVLTLRVLQDLARFTPDKPFRTQLYGQTDGITNGTAFGLFILTAPTSSTTEWMQRIAQLQAVGVGKYTANEWKNLGEIANNDFYEQAAIGERRQRNYIQNKVIPELSKLLESTKRKTYSKEYTNGLTEIVTASNGLVNLSDLNKLTQALLSFHYTKSDTKALRHVFPASLEYSVDGDYLTVTKEGRTLFKYPLMFSNYGAGFKSISESMANHSLSELLDRLAELHSLFHELNANPDTPNAHDDKVAAIKEYGELATTLESMTAASILDTEAMKKAEEATKKDEKADSTKKPKKAAKKYKVIKAHVPKIEESEHFIRLTGAQESNYFERYSAVQLPALRTGFESMFPEMTEAKKNINASAGMAFKVFTGAYYEELRKAILAKQEKLKEDLLAEYKKPGNTLQNVKPKDIQATVNQEVRDVFLTKEEEEDIFNSLVSGDVSPVPFIPTFLNQKSKFLNYDSYLKILKKSKAHSPRIVENLEIKAVEAEDESGQLEVTESTSDPVKSDSNKTTLHVTRRIQTKQEDGTTTTGRGRTTVSARSASVTYNDPSVSGLIKAIQSSDAGAMGEFLLEEIGFNVHDAILTALNKWGSSGKIINEKFAEIVMNYNIAGAFLESFQRINKYFKSLDDTDSVKRSILNSILEEFSDDVNPVVQRQRLKAWEKYQNFLKVPKKKRGEWKGKVPKKPSHWALSGEPIPAAALTTVHTRLPKSTPTENEAFAKKYNEWFKHVLKYEDTAITYPMDRMPNPLDIFEKVLSQQSQNHEAFLEHFKEYSKKAGMTFSQYSTGPIPGEFQLEEGEGDAGIDSSTQLRTADNADLAKSIDQEVRERTGEWTIGALANELKEHIGKTVKNIKEAFSTHLQLENALSDPEAIDRVLRGLAPPENGNSVQLFTAPQLSKLLERMGNNDPSVTKAEGLARLSLQERFALDILLRLGIIENASEGSTVKYTFSTNAVDIKVAKNFGKLLSRIFYDGEFASSEKINSLIKDFVQVNMVSGKNVDQKQTLKYEVATARYANTVFGNIISRIENPYLVQSDPDSSSDIGNFNEFPAADTEESGVDLDAAYKIIYSPLSWFDALGKRTAHADVGKDFNATEKYDNETDEEFEKRTKFREKGFIPRLIKNKDNPQKIFELIQSQLRYGYSAQSLKRLTQEVLQTYGIKVEDSAFVSPDLVAYTRRLTDYEKEISGLADKISTGTSSVQSIKDTISKIISKVNNFDSTVNKKEFETVEAAYKRLYSALSQIDANLRKSGISEKQYNKVMNSLFQRTFTKSLATFSSIGKSADPVTIDRLRQSLQQQEAFSVDLFSDQIEEAETANEGVAVASDPIVTTHSVSKFFSDADGDQHDMSSSIEQGEVLDSGEVMLSLLENYLATARITENHADRLRQIVKEIIANNIGNVRFQELLEESIASGARGSFDLESRLLTIQRGSDPGGYGLTKSAAEVFTHELLHPVIEFGINNDPSLRGRLLKLQEEAREAFDEEARKRELDDPAYLFLDDPLTATDAEKQKARDQYRYLFTDNSPEDVAASRSLKEFLIHGLTNERTVDLLSKIPLSGRRALNGPLTVFGLVRAGWDILFQGISNLLSRKPTKTLYDEVFKLATTIAQVNENNYERASLLGPVYKKLDQADIAFSNMIKGLLSPLDILGKSWSKAGRAVNNRTAEGLGEVVSSLGNMDGQRLREAMYKVSTSLGGSIDGFTGGLIRELTKFSKENMSIVPAIRRAKTKIEIMMQHTSQAAAKTLQQAFAQPLTKEQEESLFWTIKADLSTLFYNNKYNKHIANPIDTEAFIGMLENDEIADRYIQQLENQINAADYGVWTPYYKAAAKSLGHFQIVGQHTIENGPTNARNIAELAAFGGTDFYSPPVGDLTKLEAIVDTLASIHALKQMPVESRTTLSELIQSESKKPTKAVNGVDVFLSSHYAYKNDAIRRNKLHPRQIFKGHVKLISDPLVDFIVVDESEVYERKLEGYAVFDPEKVKGAIQPIQDGKVLMVNRTGIRRSKISGAFALNSLRNAGEFLDWDGMSSDVQYMGGFGMEIDPAAARDVKPNPTKTAAQKQKEKYRLQQTKSLYQKTIANNFSVAVSDEESVHLPLYKKEDNSIYTYRVVQTQAFRDQILNQQKQGIDVLSQMYANTILKAETDTQNAPIVQMIIEDYEDNYKDNPDAFISIKSLYLSPEKDTEKAKKDPKYARLSELYAAIPAPARKQLVDHMKATGEVYIRKESLDLLFGYREGSITELYNSTSPIGKAYTKILNLLAYATNYQINNGTVLQVENAWKDLVGMAKDNIVIKGLDVLANNVLSNIITLRMMGLSWTEIYNYQKTALVGIRAYNKNLAEFQQIRHSLLVGKVPNVRAAQKRMALLNNALINNPMHQLVQDGAYQSIVEGADNAREDYKFPNTIERFVSPIAGYLPEELRKTSRALYLSHDTELYQGLKSYTQISDFIARYALHQHNTKHRKMSYEDSFNDIMETFVEYDIPHSKGLDYLNKMGLAMFTKYLLRTQRVITKVMTERPANTLFTALVTSYLLPDVPNIIDSTLSPGTAIQAMNNPLNIMGEVFSVPAMQVGGDAIDWLTPL